MSLLDRKLIRDIAAMRGQIITIALVVAAGVAIFVSSVSTYDSLQTARDRFYGWARFPQLFVSVKRAPLSVVPRLADLPGVIAVEPRIVRDVLVDWPSLAMPISARMVSVTNPGAEILSRLRLVRGSGPSRGSTHEALINAGFADAHGIGPGVDMRIILNGRLETFLVTGIALSAEYVYAVKSGLPIPDDRYFAVLWTDRTAAEGAFAMEGAFNDAVVALTPGTNTQHAIDAIDRLLEPYGTLGALERRDQSSNRFLEDELNQQRVTSTTVPYIFFAISAFLLNVALGRLVTAQREQIAALKALGMPTATIVAHYLKFVVVIVALGAMLGIVSGIGLGRAMMESYRGFFRLPDMAFELTPWSAVAGTMISLAAGTLGVIASLRGIVTLAPAVAMRSPAPQRFHRSLIERTIAGTVRTARRMIIVRGMLGRPWHTALTVLGIALAVPMVVLGLFWRDALAYMIDVQFGLIERGNAFVTFPDPRSAHIVRDLAHEPGVIAAEGQRIIPVRLRAGHRSYLTSVIGLPMRSALRLPRDASLRPIEAPPNGIALSRRLADRLQVDVSATVSVEVLEGRRRKQDATVTSLVDEIVGMTAYMQIDVLDHLSGEGDAVSAAALYVEPSAMTSVGRRFKELPVVASLSMKSLTVNAFLEKIANLVLVSAGILTAFAVIIAAGVVYNAARIALQERAWELASLRVLGFTRDEVSRLLFAELAIELALGIPIGFVFSRQLIDLLARVHSGETFQVPPIIGAPTYGMAAMAVLAAAIASGLLVRRQIDRLDLVSALKTRE